MSSPLFQSLALRGLTLPNRIVVAPMCQYSAEDGSANDWHLLHLGSLAVAGAGLLMIEATAVTAAGRITQGCLGLYNDANEAALARVVAACRRFGNAPLGIQLAHAGRKGAATRPWEGIRALTAEEGAWPTMAPSALPLDSGWSTPQAASAEDLDRVVDAFLGATERAQRLGLDLIELHCAHGYLLHEFLSPIANHRADAYGGSRDNRMRFPLRVVAAVRQAWPSAKPLGVRISGTDWLEGGFTIEDAVAFVQALKSVGCDYVCVSSGGIVAKAPIPVAPGYQLGLAERVRRDTGIAVRAVGLVAEPRQAERVIASGQADMIAMARAFLDDPHWVWHAAEALGARAAMPPQYERARADLWPGARLVRPLREAAE
ncbi:MAG TPA: NADH:flavin oxidoreductase/NADH oxidase [Stellaceae bacterium]|nr:NADH:flavin oxidoreductase/NADH oxidase [Stellaceae bacterium]